MKRAGLSVTSRARSLAGPGPAETAPESHFSPVTSTKVKPVNVLQASEAD